MIIEFSFPLYLLLRISTLRYQGDSSYMWFQSLYFSKVDSHRNLVSIPSLWFSSLGVGGALLFSVCWILSLTFITFLLIFILCSLFSFFFLLSFLSSLSRCSFQAGFHFWKLSFNFLSFVTSPLSFSNSGPCCSFTSRTISAVSFRLDWNRKLQLRGYFWHAFIVCRNILLLPLFALLLLYGVFSGHFSVALLFLVRKPNRGRG